MGQVKSQAGIKLLNGFLMQDMKLNQSPFVDVVKYASKNEKIGVQKKGKVTEELDRSIGKKVYVLEGAISPNNTVTIPSNRSVSLNLIGQFGYFHCYVNPEFQYSFHFTLITKDDHQITLCFSNIYREYKKTFRKLLIPSSEIFQEAKWSVLVIDFVKILRKWYNKSFHSLKTLRMESSIVFRNLYTSNIIYYPEKLPREMFLPLRKDQNWYDRYNCIWYPEKPEVIPSKKLVNETPQTDLGKLSFGSIPEKARNKKKKKNKNKKLRTFTPDPIVNIRQVMGYGHSKIRWIGNRFFVYLCTNKVVRYNIETKEQRIFHGTGNKISCFCINLEKNLLVTGEEGDEIPMIRIWDLTTTECLCVLFGGFYQIIECVDISMSGQMIVATGRELKNDKKLIMLWDSSRIRDTKKCFFLLKGYSVFPITQLSFIPFQDKQFVTVGPGSIRFWRVKSGSLRSCSLVVRQNNSSLLKNVEFRDLSIEYSFEHRETKEIRIYASTAQGQVYQIRYGQRIIEGVYQLHNQSIDSLYVNEGMCVTGSRDGTVRVWPLDFSDFFMEVEHDSTISNVSISDDGILLAIGTTTGSVGTLDLTNQKYSTLIRSHSQPVVSIDMDPQHVNQFATVSEDLSIRIWDSETFEQLFQFDTIGESPLILKYHPTKYQFGVGFNSGIIRIFDITTTTLIEEFKPHDCAIQDMLYTHSDEGKWLISVSRKNLCISDCHHDYQQAKVLYFKTQKKRKMGGDGEKKTKLCLSPNGKHLGTIGPEKNKIHVFDTTSFFQTHTFEIDSEEMFTNLVFSYDSKEIITTTEASKILRLSMENGSVVMERTKCHRGDITNISVLGKYVLTAGEDSLFKVWDCETLRYQSFLGHSDRLTCAVFSRFGNLVGTVGMDSTIILWNFLDQPNTRVRTDEMIDQMIDVQKREEEEEVEGEDVNNNNMYDREEELFGARGDRDVDILGKKPDFEGMVSQLLEDAKNREMNKKRKEEEEKKRKEEEERKRNEIMKYDLVIGDDDDEPLEIIEKVSKRDDDDEEEEEIDNIMGDFEKIHV